MEIRGAVAGRGGRIGLCPSCVCRENEGGQLSILRSSRVDRRGAVLGDGLGGERGARQWLTAWLTPCISPFRRLS